MVATLAFASPASASRDGLEAQAPRGPVGQLNDIDRRITDLVRRRQELEDLKEDLNLEIERAGGRLIRSREAGDKARSTRLRRLVLLRRQGRVLQAGLLLGPRTVHGLMLRQRALGAVLVHDRRLAEHHLDRAGALAAATDQGGIVRRRLNALTESLGALERSLALGRAERVALLEAVAKDPRIARRAQREIADGRRNLAKRLSDPGAALPDVPLSLGKGRLAFPVRGEIVRKYGALRKGRWGPTVRNEGVDIEAAAGSEVRAVWGGKVSYADWLPGFGLVVILDHGVGWHTVYGHLQGTVVSRGLRVAPGDPLGRVGDTGTWDAPHLHFEVRKGKVSQDPADWLAVR